MTVEQRPENGLMVEFGGLVPQDGTRLDMCFKCYSRVDDGRFRWELRRVFQYFYDWKTTR